PVAAAQAVATPQPTAAPVVLATTAMLAAPVAQPAARSALEHVVLEQLRVMEKQLAVLGGTTAPSPQITVVDVAAPAAGNGVQQHAAAAPAPTPAVTPAPAPVPARAMPIP